jgi:hypothetical protein
MSAPMLSRSHAVPMGPSAGINPADRAEPSWMENMAAMVSAHGGIAGLEVVIVGSPWSGIHCLHATSEAWSRQGGFVDEMVCDGDAGPEPGQMGCQFLGGRLQGLSANRIQGIQDEQRAGGFVP